MPNLLSKIEVQGLATDYSAGDWIAPHRHAAHQIVHASAGVLRVVAESASWVVPPGRAVWMPAGRQHAIRCHTDVAMRTVYLSGSGLAGVNPALPSECAVWAVSPLMREIAVRISTGPEAKGLEPLLALLLLEVESITELPIRLPLPTDPRLRRLTDALQAEPAEQRPLAFWSKEIGISERSLIRKFQAETG